MFDVKTLKALEFEKVAESISKYAVLERTKDLIKNLSPNSSYAFSNKLLDTTNEAYILLYEYSVGRVCYFSSVEDELKRVDKGGTLNNAEILNVCSALRSARLIKTSITKVNDENILYLSEVASRLFVNQEFENEVSKIIISEEEISDSASEKLYNIRKTIRSLTAKIRDKLNSYMRGESSKFLQDSVVTMRQDRYVIPVKSEHRSKVKGFIHDQSSSGSTVFIEPEYVMELNNELKKASFDEREEIFRILSDLSNKISFMSDAIRYNHDNLVEIDSFFARAEYSFNEKCVRPILNDKGKVVINGGRHPLIAIDKVVPVWLKLGQNYNFLLVTGPNTGGKTVTLKLLGLFSVMAMCGIFVPALDGTELSVYNGIFCDIGDEQSIEQNLSTFSSHIKNIIYILNNIDSKSLVLLDELGAGTDPEEGSALALSIIKRLLDLNCFGVITTHYSTLKEYAMSDQRIINASMEFDVNTLRPLYKINIGIPGSSNALEIAKTLGLDQNILNDAVKCLSQEKIEFEKVLKCAEASKRENDNLRVELERLKLEREKELENIKEERKKITEKREKIYLQARQETKQIVSGKLEEAEEIIDEIKSILKKLDLESKELFRASELKNRLKNSRYLQPDTDEPLELIAVKPKALKSGDSVYVKSLGVTASILSVKNNLQEAEVLIGEIKTKVKISDLYNSERKMKPKQSVMLNRKLSVSQFKAEINVIGKTTLDALDDVRNFIDNAIVCNAEEIKIIHGIGEGKLLKAIRDYLKTEKNVAEFRAGKYGEGENGVTIVKLK